MLVLELIRVQHIPHSYLGSLRVEEIEFLVDSRFMR